MLRRWASRAFAIDLRSLALFRVGLALLVLADLSMRAMDLRAHYSDAGVLPRADLLADPVGQGLRFFSLHMLGGSVEFEAALFALQILLALALGLGLRTRLATFGTWVLLLSLQNRNPLVHYGGDNFLALMLFWGLFVPMGARWSLDAARGRGVPAGAGHVLSWGSAGLLLQIALIYPFSALHKTGSEWMPEGSAIFYALHIQQFSLPLGAVLRQWPGPLRVATWGVYVLELGVPLLLFAPRFALPLRLLGIASIFAFHAGIALTMVLLLFNWIGMLTILVFLPAWFWDELLQADRRSARSEAQPGEGGPPPGEPIRGPASLLRSLTREPAPRGARVGQTRAGSVAAAAALAFVIFWNVATLRESWEEAVTGHPVLSWLAAPGLALRLGQTWFMFSPHPPKQTTWMVLVGVLEDGSRVDLRWGGPPRFGQPRARGDYNEDGRWERLLSNAAKTPYVKGYRGIGRYLCRRWNDDPEHQVRVKEVRIFARALPTLLEGRAEPEPPRLRFRGRCPAEASAAPSEARARDAGAPSL